MEYTIHRISLDIHSVKSQTTLRVKQGDTSRKLHITLCEGGLPYHIADDCSAVFSALKPDKRYINNKCQIVGNIIEYDFSKQTTAAVGVMDCEITLYDINEQRITSPHFTIIVEERVYNGQAVVSSPEANVLDSLIDRAETVISKGETIINDILATRISSVTLWANRWKGDTSPFSQVVDLPDIDENSMVDLTPSVEQLTIFYNKDLAFVTENVDGEVTVYAIGQKPTADYTMSVAITEVKT